MKDTINDLANKYERDSIRIRNLIHQHPELSFEEEKTAQVIEKELLSYGISPVRIIGTGVLAVIGKNTHTTVVLRADTDALPIQENETHPVCSKNAGVMHACGHDMHTASLLGTARILKEIEHELKGRVVLLFQPGEEKFPGGAKLILDDGVLNTYQPDWIVAQHTDPELETGETGFRSGPYMASADEIYLTVEGNGGHAAFPHKLTDTVLAASQIIVSLQQVISRKKDPSLPSVLSFGNFIAKGATNVIPGKIDIAGTFRTLDETWRKEGRKHIHDIIHHTAKAMGVGCKIDIKDGYPSLSNHPEFTEYAKQCATQYLGEEKVKDLGVRMGGEDFSYYSQKYPATFYRFGVKPKGTKDMANLHSPDFFGDEKALKTSMGTMAFIAWSFLEQQHNRT